MTEPAPSNERATSSKRRRPYRSPSRASSGVQIEAVRRVAVTSQAASDGVMFSSSGNRGSSGATSVWTSDPATALRARIVTTSATRRSAFGAADGCPAELSGAAIPGSERPGAMSPGVGRRRAASRTQPPPLTGRVSGQACTPAANLALARQQGAVNTCSALPPPSGSSFAAARALAVIRRSDLGRRFVT